MLKFVVCFFAWAPLVHAVCFKFDHKMTLPLQPPMALKDSDISELGSGKNGVQWGALRGVVKRPIAALLKSFEDPYLTKNRKNTKITKKISKSPHYLWIRKMHLEVKPIFFVTIEWDEEWAVALREGTEMEPKSFIVYYQKVAGTSHLEHLCGNILVTARDKDHCDVYLYEEVRASHWTNEDAVKNFQVVLKIFRGEHKDD